MARLVSVSRCYTVVIYKVHTSLHNTEPHSFTLYSPFNQIQTLKNFRAKCISSIQT